MNEDIFNKIDNIMIEQIEKLRSLTPTDKDFNANKEKAKTITLIADKIIQSQVAQLKMDIWQHSKQMGKVNQKALADASYIDYEE